MDKDGKVIERGYGNVETQIDKGKGGDSYFQISPSGAIKDRDKNETDIGGFQYLQTGVTTGEKVKRLKVFLLALKQVV